MIPVLFDRNETTFVATINFLFECLVDFEEEAVSLQVSIIQLASLIW